MATSSELRSSFEYDVDMRGGLDEFEPESWSERAGLQILAGRSAGEVLPRANDELRLPRRRWPIVMPVAAAVLALSAVVAGFALREEGLPPLPSAPASSAGAGALVTPIPIADVPEPAAPARAGETLHAPGDPMRGAIDEALSGVSHSFRALDAAALRRVWPGADVAAWSARFSTLKYQALSFGRCDVRPVGAAQIVASCDASIAAAAKSGDPTLQRRHESWSIVFNRSGDRYVIGSTLIR